MAELYEYQKEAVAKVFAAFENYKCVMLQMPTGTGKTHVFCDIINKKKNSRVLVLVHRRELVKQIKDRLLKFGLPAGIILAGEIPRPVYMVQIASIQSLARRDFTTWPNPSSLSLIIIDEAHHATAQTYKNILEFYSPNNKIKILGVTATPCRTDKSGFKDVFGTLITSKSIKQFIVDKELPGFKHLATDELSLNKIKIDPKTKDYEINELGNFMSSKTIMADLIESYKKHANNRQCIVFAVNVSHSNKIVERFIDAGITAASIDSKTPENERNEILLKFKSGAIQVLSNVQIFTEGFDCPKIGVVQLARPTKSFALYLQMVGRCLRIKDDASDALILDNASLWKTHGTITKDINWTLDGVELSSGTQTTRDPKTDEVSEIEPKNIIEIKGGEMGLIDLIIHETPTESIDRRLILKIIEKKNNLIYKTGRAIGDTINVCELLEPNHYKSSIKSFLCSVFEIHNTICTFSNPEFRIFLGEIDLKINKTYTEFLKKRESPPGDSYTWLSLYLNIKIKIIKYEIKNKTQDPNYTFVHSINEEESLDLPEGLKAAFLKSNPS